MSAKLFRKDFKTDTWDRVRAVLDERIEELRTQLESRTNTEHTTAATRGALTELRKMLALETSPADEPRPGDRIGQSAEAIEVQGFLRGPDN